MNTNPYVMLLDLQQASVNYWKMFGLDFSPMIDDLWSKPVWEWYFDQYTAPGGCLEGYQYVHGC